MAEITQDSRLLSIETPLGKDFLMINKMSADEGLSRLFSIEAELIHEEDDAGEVFTAVNPEDILGQSVTVGVTQEDGGARTFNGIVNAFSQGSRHTRFSFYHITIVPHVWLLTQNIQSRIFQHLSVPDILRKVFEGFEVSYEMQGDFKPRNYCVQYRESDFAFASRLMEEEGIYYFFEHSDSKHKLIIANTPQSHPDCPNKKEIPFPYDLPENSAWQSTVYSWGLSNRLQSGKVTLWDFNFQLPTQKLDAEQPTRFNVGGNSDLEIYDHPAGYARKFDGIDKSGGERASDLQNIYQDKQKTVKDRMDSLDAQYGVFEAVSDCCTLTAGHRFDLKNHPTKNFNTKYTITSVRHEAVQTPDYTSGENVIRAYTANFSCIAHTTAYRPPPMTEKPVVQGSQTAFVVGPAGEEIFTDKYGRVKVQMHWDREGEINENSSCWIRVAQAWAGNRWGMMFIPRIGMEVIVHFLEGDPDQPIITGCVYNAGAMPPYQLPEEKTKMTIKSDSSKGGNGFNEIRFEDKKDSEQVFIHGEKDLDIRIKNDRREWTGNDQHLVVKNDRREKIDQDTHLIVGRNQVEEIKGDCHRHISGEEAVKIGGGLSLKVGGSYSEAIGSNLSSEATGSYYIKGMNVVIEAMTGLTIKVGGSFVSINAGGVQISGPMVLINSGGAALSGSAGAITPPQAPAAADDADDAKPGTKITLEKRSAARKEKRHKEGDPEKKSWIKIKLVDEDGNPVPGKRFKVTTPDGRTASGSTDKEGKGEIKGIKPGNCKVTFPDLDSEAWEEG